MKALVTGATGFIGSHVARLLVQAGHEVTVLVRRSSPLANLEGMDLRRVTGDLTDEASLREAVCGQQGVFHVAALYALWSRDPSAFDRINVDGTRSLLRAAADAGAERIVYTSTIGAVRGSAPGEVADETSAFNLNETGDPYIRTKRAAEEVALALAAEGAPVVVVNPCTPLGPGDIKPTPTGEAIVQFVNGLLPGYVDGGVNVVDVRDVARGHLLAFERGRVGERYILGAENVTMRELMELFARTTGLPAPRLRMPFGAVSASAALLEAAAALTGRPPMLTRSNVRVLRHMLHATSAKAERELGYRPGPIEPAIRAAVEDFDRRGLLRTSRMRRVHAHFEKGRAPFSAAVAGASPSREQREG